MIFLLSIDRSFINKTDKFLQKTSKSTDEEITLTLDRSTGFENLSLKYGSSIFGDFENYPRLKKGSEQN